MILSIFLNLAVLWAWEEHGDAALDVLTATWFLLKAFFILKVRT